MRYFIEIITKNSEKKIKNILKKKGKQFLKNKFEKNVGRIILKKKIG